MLVWAAEDFAARGVETARLDAELLLAHALGSDRIRLVIDALRPLDQAELLNYRELIRRRRAGEPVAYILGRREFYGLQFYVDSRVLIPRPDTEALVDTALERSAALVESGRYLDLCTGSGCVALAFASRRRGWDITGIDLSEAALEVARQNAETLGADWGVRFLLGDLTAPLQPGECFDVITANPPYIPNAEIAELDVGIRDFEPRFALEGGDDGLHVIKRIMTTILSHLNPGGLLALEVAYDQAARVGALLRGAGFIDVEIRRDYGGNERVVSGLLER